MSDFGKNSGSRMNRAPAMTKDIPMTRAMTGDGRGKGSAKAIAAASPVRTMTSDEGRRLPRSGTAVNARGGRA